MPEQIQVSNTQWVVGEGAVELPDGTKDTAVVCVFTDILTEKSYMFPIPDDEAKEMAKVLEADDREEAMMAYSKRKQARAKLTATDAMPSNADLRKAQRMGKS